jgi:hypothetical protein
MAGRTRFFDFHRCLPLEDVTQLSTEIMAGLHVIIRMNPLLMLRAARVIDNWIAERL